MNPVSITPSFENWRALILHRPHPNVESITRQLSQIGIEAETCWPDLPADLDPAGFDIIFFDADMGYDAQFPWQPGTAPIPAIALIGSEAPGRIAWAIRRGADAHLLKPVGSGGIYSAVLIACQAFDKRQSLGAEVAGLKASLAKREDLAGATAYLMQTRGVSARDAYRALRQMAMSERLSIDDMAEQILDRIPGFEGRNDRA